MLKLKEMILKCDIKKMDKYLGDKHIFEDMLTIPSAVCQFRKSLYEGINSATFIRLFLALLVM